MGYWNCGHKEKAAEKKVKVVFVKPGEKVLVIGKKEKKRMHHRKCKHYYY